MTRTERLVMKGLFLPILISAVALTTVSCSKEDVPGDPEGTAMLNMYN